jgi:hypothetical protein
MFYLCSCRSCTPTLHKLNLSLDGAQRHLDMFLQTTSYHALFLRRVSNSPLEPDSFRLPRYIGGQDLQNLLDYHQRTSHSSFHISTSPLS